MQAAEQLGSCRNGAEVRVHYNRKKLRQLIRAIGNHTDGNVQTSNLSHPTSVVSSRSSGMQRAVSSCHVMHMHRAHDITAELGPTSARVTRQRRREDGHTDPRIDSRELPVINL